MPRKTSDATDGEAVTPEDDVTRPTPDAPEDPEAAGLAAEQRRGVPGLGVEEGAADPERDPAQPDPLASEAAATAPGDPAEPRPRGSEPAAEREPDDHDDDPHGEDDGGGSFAGRALAALILLLIGVGLGIWAAPRVAPLLPAGMAPVADWLAPDRRLAAERLVALEAELDETAARVGALAEAPAGDPAVEARVADLESRLSEAQSRLSGELAALGDRVTEAGGAETRQRLSRLESSLEGQASELAALKEQLAARPAEGGQSAAASAETAQQVDLYRAEVEGLRAEMGTLSDQVSALAARIDEVAAGAERRVAEAENRSATVQQDAQTAMDTAAAEADLARIRAAIADGEPYADALARLNEAGQIELPEALREAAPAGVATLTELRDRFSDAAHQAIRAEIQAGAGDGVVARSRAFLQSQIASRSLSPQQGTDADAVLSRMEDALRRGDLQAVLAEADGLPHAAMVAMAGWLGDAQQRAQAVEGLAALSAQVTATN
jgi:hypothetical protein